MFRNTAFALGLVLAAPAAFAQTAPAAEPIDPSLAYEAARNQLGILKYCADQGHTGTEAVAAQEKMVGMLPAGDTAAGEQAEAKGAAGTVSIGETEVTLADAAANQNTTVDAQCKQIEAAVNQVAAQLPG
jgi:hypothetical protein